MTSECGSPKAGMNQSARIGIYVVLVAVQKLISVAVQPLIMRMLTPAQYGEISQIVVVLSLAVLVVTFAADEIIARIYHLAGCAREGYLRISEYVCIYVIGTSICVLFVALAAYCRASQLELVYMFGAVFVLFAPLVSIAQKILRTSDKTTQLALFNISYSFLLGGGALIALTYSNSSIQAYFVAQGVVQFVFGSSVAVYFIKKGGWRPNFVAVKGILREASSAVPHTVVGWGFVGFTTYYVASVLGTYSAGLLGAGLYMYSVVSAISDVAVNVMQPRIYDARKNSGNMDVLRAIRKSLVYVSISLTGVGVAVATFSNDVMPFILPKAYLVNVYIAPCLVLSATVLGLGSLWVFFLYYDRQGLSKLSRISVMGVVINLVATPFGVHFLESRVPLGACCL